MQRLPPYSKIKVRVTADSLCNSGVDKCYQQDYREGIDDFNRALSLNPHHKVAAFNKALALIEWGHIQVLAGHDKINSALSELAKLPDMRTDFIQEILRQLHEDFNVLHNLN